MKMFSFHSQVGSCNRYFHLPCAAASSSFQDTKTLSLFCSQHLGQVPLLCKYLSFSFAHFIRKTQVQYFYRRFFKNSIIWIESPNFELTRVTFTTQNVSKWLFIVREELQNRAFHKTQINVKLTMRLLAK